MAEDRDDAATQTATSSPSGPAAIAISAATAIGRFAVLGAIGAGGMGQVFSAYDPQLDRRVALKLLHGAGSVLERQRLVREAQALARLSHPNVVTVHEVGEHDGHVFVAMEFVEGATLREWIDEHPPGGRERLVRALELMRDAGQGIAAAHAAGLVHRDIKPRNILVGADGRVRVVDFGLARSTATEPEELAATLKPEERDLMSSAESGPGASALLGASLTEADKIVGTPAYMAPEQFRRGPIDQSADQFSFCVTAWEALFGVRPYGGSLAAMLIAIDDGAFERPKEIEVPAAVESALRRGLSRRPSRRHRDLAALLAVFEEAIATLRGQAPPRRKSRWALVGGVVAVATAGAFWLGARDDRRCAGAEERFADVWDSTRKAEIEAAVRATEASFAPATWSRLEQNVDDWRTAWIAGFVDACEAAQVRGTQSQQLMDQRMACLDDRQQRLVAYLDLLATPTVEIIANADEGFANLPDVARCTDVEYVAHRGQRSDDPEIAAIEDAVLAELARARSLQAADDQEHALAIAESAARTATPSEWARAQALLVVGSALSQLYRPNEAVDALAEAYRLARATNVDEVAAEASRLAAHASGVTLKRAEQGEWWVGIAAIEAERARDHDAIASVMVIDAKIDRERGRLEEARATLEAAMVIVSPESRAQVLVLGALGGIAVNLGDRDAGFELLARARKLRERQLGPDHPALADLHRAEAQAFVWAGRNDEALVSAERALAIAEAAFGERHVETYPCLDTLANVVWERGDAERTLALLRRAVQVDRPAPLVPVLAASVISRQGDTLLAMGRLDEAIVSLREALALSINALGAWHPDTALRRVELANALADQGALDEAMRLVDQALASDLAAVGEQSELMVRLHDRVAEVFERAGKLERAAEHIRRAVTLSSAMGKRPTIVSVKARSNLCGIVRQIGGYAEAVAACTAALAEAETLPELPPNLRAQLHNTMGAVHSDTGMPTAARRHYVEAMRLLELMPRRQPDILEGVLLANIAEIDLQSGALEDASEGYARSVAFREHVWGSDSSLLVVPLRGLAASHLAMSRRDDAIAAGRRALAIASSSNSDPLEQAQVRFVLAQALWADAARRREARALATEAARQSRQTGERGAAVTSTVDAWLAAR